MDDNTLQVMQMDVLPTLDGTPVFFHDINMKRATGLDVDIRQVSCLPRMLPDCHHPWSREGPIRLSIT